MATRGHSGILWIFLLVGVLGSVACGGSSSGCDCGAAGADGAAGAGGADGVAGTGGDGGAGGVGGVAAPKAQEVLFVGGFMSELYTWMSENLEDELNAALRAAARRLNVHIDLPLNQSIDIPIGDSIASALPQIDILEEGGFITFYEQSEYFDLHSVPYTNISDWSSTFDTSETVQHNADAIVEFLRSTDKQVVIVSHSKGGLDTLDALLDILRDEPALLDSTVVGWVALQAPFRGTLVADSAPSPINDLLLGALGGNGASVDDLKTTNRVPYMDELFASDIGRLTSRIPVVSAYSTYVASGPITAFASTFANGIFNSGLVSQITQIVVDNYWDTPLDIPRVLRASASAAVNLIDQRIRSSLGAALATIGLMDLTNGYLELRGQANDGLVPADSTVLAGATRRPLSTADHASPVMDVDPLKNFWSVESRNQTTVDLIREVREMAGVPTD